MTDRHWPKRARPANIDVGAIQSSVKVLARYVESGRIRCSSMVVGFNGSIVAEWAGGTRGDAPAPLSPNVEPSTRFLVASLTKPVTAAAAMRLVETGDVGLTTLAKDVLPEFGGCGREHIRVWHLLSHSSGLPDMLPENQSLRDRGALLDEFFDGVCRVRPAFAPGSSTKYQSMGLLVLAKIIERITATSFADFVASELFVPLGMASAALGSGAMNRAQDDVEVVLPPGQVGKSWHWNSDYWRGLGAPWGGLVVSATDLHRFLSVFLRRGHTEGGRRVLSPATVCAMTREVRVGGEDSYGLGWKLRGYSPPTVPRQDEASQRASIADEVRAGIVAPEDATLGRGFMGDLCSPITFGHGGATGCAMWADPASGLSVVILTSNPDALHGGPIARISSVISASVT